MGDKVMGDTEQGINQRFQDQQLWVQLQIRVGEAHENALIAKHFSCMWRDNDVADTSIRPDWQEITLQFIDRVRQEQSYTAFVAELENAIVGSASCQLFAGLYPNILTDDYRKYGYIWGVYVEPPYRRLGIAKQLTNRAIDHLKSLGCTRAILHASPFGKPLYSKLGFYPSNEMRLDFPPLD